MQKLGCHSHNTLSHCRKPERWNRGWSNGKACQMHQKCNKDIADPNVSAKDMMHKKFHNHHHHHSRGIQNAHFSLCKHHHHHGHGHFNHYGHGHGHFNHHGHGHGHFNHHGHGHGHFNPHRHGSPKQTCGNVSTPSHSCCSHSNRPACESSSPKPTEPNTRSVGTETEDVIQSST